MKSLVILNLMIISSVSFANPNPQVHKPVPQKTEALKPKMTATQAKELCKQEGQSGQNLIDCIREKQK